MSLTHKDHIRLVSFLEQKIENDKKILEEAVLLIKELTVPSVAMSRTTKDELAKFITDWGIRAEAFTAKVENR